MGSFWNSASLLSSQNSSLWRAGRVLGWGIPYGYGRSSSSCAPHPGGERELGANWEQPRLPTLPSSKDKSPEHRAQNSLGAVDPVGNSPSRFSSQALPKIWALGSADGAATPGDPDLESGGFQVDFGELLTHNQLGNQKWITGWMTRSSLPFPHGSVTSQKIPGFVHPSSETPRNRSPNFMGKNTPGMENAHKCKSSFPSPGCSAPKDSGVPKRDHCRIRPRNPSNLTERDPWSRDGRTWMRRGSVEITPGLLGAGPGLILGLEAPLPTPCGFQRLGLLFRGISGMLQTPPSQRAGWDPGAESQHWELSPSPSPSRSSRTRIHQKIPGDKQRWG